MKIEKEQDLVLSKKQDLGLPKSSDANLTHMGALHSLRVAAHRLADTRKKPKLKTRDLVGLLLSHSARAWRSSMPHVAVKISVKMPNGTPAVRLSFPVNSLGG
jgi:hypothetical protein